MIDDSFRNKYKAKGDADVVPSKRALAPMEIFQRPESFDRESGLVTPLHEVLVIAVV